MYRFRHLEFQAGFCDGSTDSVEVFFFFNDTATTEIYTLSLHDALPISSAPRTTGGRRDRRPTIASYSPARSEEHTSELQSPCNLVCRLLLEKKKHTQAIVAPFDVDDANLLPNQLIRDLALHAPLSAQLP